MCNKHLHTKVDKKNKSNLEMAMAVRKKEINTQNTQNMKERKNRTAGYERKVQPSSIWDRRIITKMIVL